MDIKLFERVPTKRLGEIVYQSLVEAIASGRLPEATKLYENEIAKQMGISTTPVREALRHLEKDGFVEAGLHRTPVVRPLNRQDIDDIYRVREYLEPLGVRLATEHLGSPQVAGLLTVQREMEERFGRGETVDVAESVRYNQTFHRTLVAAGDNERLKAIMEPLWIQILRLSFLSHRTYRSPGKQARAVAEHRAILDAILCGDAERGEALIREHVRNGHRDLVSSLPPASGEGGSERSGEMRPRSTQTEGRT